MDTIFYIIIGILAYIGLISVMKKTLDYLVDKFNK